MKKNMAMLDQIIRLIIAVLIVVLYFTGQISGIAAIILGIVAVAFLFTGLVGWCPFYALLGLSTRKKEEP